MATFTENEFRGVSLKMNDVFVSMSKDLPTPSASDGLDDFSEMALRIIGCEFIQDAGKMLKLPQVAIACAQVLYHRFYFSKSFVRHNWEHYAMSCVFLSAKIEECCRRLRDVVNVFVHIRQLREQKILKCLSIAEYAELKPYIIKAERRVLKELGFCVHGKHPHKLICIYLHILAQDKNKDLVQLSWNYMNDSLRTTVFCRYQPEIIACACIYLAAVHLQFPLGISWFEIFGAKEPMIQAICVAILKLYSIKNLNIETLETMVANLKKLQIEARNIKIGDEKKDGVVSGQNGGGGGGVRGRPSEDGGTRRGNDSDGAMGKDNVEMNEEQQQHRRTHGRKSVTPRMERRRYRSRSGRRTMDRIRSSERRKKSHRRCSGKETSVRKHGQSLAGVVEEQITDGRMGTHKDGHKQMSSSPHPPTNHKPCYRTRKRSSSPISATGRNGLQKSASKHSVKKFQNGKKSK